MVKDKEAVNHPDHYGGKDNPYEVIKVLFAWGLDKSFCLGNTLKYVARAGKKDPKAVLEDLKKARWYLDYEIKQREGVPMPPDDGRPPALPVSGPGR